MTVGIKATRKALDDMTSDELREHIMQIREGRKMFKVDPVKRKRESKTFQSKKGGLQKLLASLTPEEKQALLEKYRK